MVYFFHVYRFFLKYLKMFVNQDGGVEMTSYSHDMNIHRKNGRMRLLKTLRYMYFCMSDFWDSAGQVYLWI